MIDFEGQRLAENLAHYLLVASGVLGFLIGFAQSSLQTGFFVLLAGGVVTALVTIPPWPMYSRHPIQFLPSLAETEELYKSRRRGDSGAPSQNETNSETKK